MQYGKVKMFDPLKGFGFIITEDDDDLYFAVADIHPKYKNTPVREGMQVGFDFRREMRGDRAVNVRLIK